jgi:hypothetical protein
LSLVEGGRWVATIIPKKKKKPDLSALEARAFDMFVTLNAEFKHVYKLSRIAKELGISLSQVMRWRTEGKWAERLEEAIHKARERASSSAQMKQLLTSYLYGEQIPDEVGVDPAKILEELEKRKARRITKVVKYLGDVIYEVREYNHLMFCALTAKKDSGKMPSLELPLGSRDTAHRAWMDSLNKLMELFGVGTIKELAMELMANDLLSGHLQSPATVRDGTTVNISIGGKTLPEIAEGGTTIVLDDATHELILREMRGGEGGKISGPVGYTGPKEKNVFDGAEDAVVSQSKRPDSEGEE